MRKTKKPTPGWKTAFGIKKSTVAADKLWDMFCTQHRPVIAEASKRLESVRQSQGQEVRRAQEGQLEGQAARQLPELRGAHQPGGQAPGAARDRRQRGGS